MEYIEGSEKIIEEGDGDGGWVDTHHNVEINPQPKDDQEMKVEGSSHFRIRPNRAIIVLLHLNIGLCYWLF